MIRCVRCWGGGFVQLHGEAMGVDSIPRERGFLFRRAAALVIGTLLWRFYLIGLMLS